MGIIYPQGFWLRWWTEAGLLLPWAVEKVVAAEAEVQVAREKAEGFEAYLRRRGWIGGRCRLAWYWSGMSAGVTGVTKPNKRLARELRILIIGIEDARPNFLCHVLDKCGTCAEAIFFTALLL